MPYFRYDNNKRGFDMAGIEWSVFNARELNFRDKMAIGLKSDDHEGYVTIITRNNQRIATLNEMDTARFITRITDDGKDKTGRPNPPRPITSCVAVIEEFLGAGDRV